MKEEQQNHFYSSISPFYSEIFPFNPAQLSFVEHELKSLRNKSVLDIGCATGELAYEMCRKEAVVTGIDLNEDLINQAIQTKKAEQLHFRTGNMLELKNDFNSSQIDALICFGNTLVHLPALSEVEEMFSGAKYVLKPGGIMLLQILNYDYILSEGISELPLIETPLIRFTRRYKWENNAYAIRFITELTVKKEDRIFQHETKLLALKSDTLRNLLVKTGFTEIEFYSNFNQNPFCGKHLPLVVRCKA